MTRQTRALFDYWKSCTQGSKLPKKTDLKPQNMVQLLPNLFILEFTRDAEVNVRLCGTFICEVYGENLTGQNMVTFYPDNQRLDLIQFLKHITSMPVAGMTVRQMVNRWSSKTTLKSLYLPCTDEQGAVRFAIGVTDTVRSPLASAQIKSVKDLRAVGAPRLNYFDIGFGKPSI